MDIIIERSYLSDGKATLGKLTTESGYECYTLELPWKENKRSVSCIPEGTYNLRKRISPVVKRTSRGEFEEGWEVVDVEGRSFIMFHVGNYTRDSDGCILVGNDLAWNNNGFMVTHSINTFRSFMKALSKEDEHTLVVSQYTPVKKPSEASKSHSEPVKEPIRVIVSDREEKPSQGFLSRLKNIFGG